MGWGLSGKKKEGLVARRNYERWNCEENQHFQFREGKEQFSFIDRRQEEKE